MLTHGIELQYFLSINLPKSTLRPMIETDLTTCVELIDYAMDSNEANYAQKTFTYHFDCKSKGIDDGRQLFVLINHENVRGVVGLHQIEWGPPSQVWLSFFAIHPDLQGRGFGKAIFEASLAIARAFDYKKMMIETYSGETFRKARSFYEKQGFELAGITKEYLPDGQSMLIYSRILQGTEHGKTERTTGTDS